MNRSQVTSNADVSPEISDDDLEHVMHVNKESKIEDPLLAYVLFAMQSGSADLIKKAVAGHFSMDQVITAKNILWANCEDTIIGDKKRRRDSHVKSSKESHINDIVTALATLDAANKTPNIYLNAMDLKLIPRSHPEELNNISLVDRLNRMEMKLSNLQETLDRTVADNIDLRQIVENKKSYASVVSPRPASNPPPKYTRPRGEDPHNSSGRNQQPVTSVDIRPVTRSATTEHGARDLSDRPLFDRLVEQDRSTDTDGFQVPRLAAKRIRRRQPPRIISGKKTNVTGTIKGAPEPLRHLFIYRVDRDTVDNEVKEYISEQGFSVKEFKRVSNEEAKFKSFKLSVPVSEYDRLFDDEIWPTGFRIRQFTVRSDRSTINNG